MQERKNRFTLKVILSYIILAGFGVLVSYFLLSEYRSLLRQDEALNDKKFIETGTLINLVYETDGYSKLALLTENNADFKIYQQKTDSLYSKLQEIKLLIGSDLQKHQIDSITKLLKEKDRNIEQLRVLNLTNGNDTSLDDIMLEFKKLETSMGKSSLETLVENPNKLSEKERRVLQSYADYLNSNLEKDAPKLDKKTVDSMLVASRFIVKEAKKENSKIRQSLLEKENELIKNDLTISNSLRGIIQLFDAEITRYNLIETAAREKTVAKTKDILKYSGIVAILIVLFSIYLILSDFFKAEKFKKSLEKSKNYSESLLKSREQLISTVSHDLKTPLNTVIGYAGLIENTPLSTKQQYYINQIKNGADFIAHLVDDLLDYSKLEAGKLVLDEVPFSLGKLVTETATAIKDFYADKKIELEITLDEPIKNGIFKSDPLRIKQILNNLIGNAFKFTNEGKVNVHVKVSETQLKTAEVQIIVSDSGIGISKEQQKFIFQEFTQADLSTSKIYGGSGLGLAICEKLVGLLKGHITVNSTPDVGSSFIVKLPLEIIAAEKPVENVPQQQRLKQLSVLVFDDDASLLSLLKEFFDQLNINCNAFTCFSEFEKQDQKPHYSFVLTDIQMPKIDGFEVLRKLKQEYFNLEGIPVIAMTGSKEHARSYYTNIGFAEVLNKPFTKENLVNILNELFQNRFLKEAITGNNLYNTTFEGFDLKKISMFLDTEAAVAEVLNTLKIQTEIDVVSIENAVKTSDFVTLGKISHRMLNMFRQIDAADVILILEKFENSGNNKMEKADLNKLLVDLTLNTTSIFEQLTVRFKWN